MKKIVIMSIGLNTILSASVIVLALQVRSVGMRRKVDANRMLDLAEAKLLEARDLSDVAQNQMKEIQQKIWEVQKNISSHPPQKAREIVYVSTPESRNEQKKFCSPTSVDSEFEQIRKSERSMTEAQFAEYAKPYLGKYIRWTGWVEAVEKDGCSYTVKIDMDSPGTLFSVYEILLKNIDQYQALRLQTNQRLTFAGNVLSMSKDISLNIQLTSVTLY